jgi:uncharacterized protein YbjQ (UPF0145 family)
MADSITIVKVVSKDFVADIIAKVQNLIGYNLTSYEKMVDKAITQINDELSTKNIEMSWYRYEITQLTNGAVAVMLYGDKK